MWKCAWQWSRASAHIHSLAVLLLLACSQLGLDISLQQSAWTSQSVLPFARHNTTQADCWHTLWSYLQKRAAERGASKQLVLEMECIVSEGGHKDTGLRTAGYISSTRLSHQLVLDTCHPTFLASSSDTPQTVTLSETAAQGFEWRGHCQSLPEGREPRRPRHTYWFCKWFWGPWACHSFANERWQDICSTVTLFFWFNLLRSHNLISSLDLSWARARQTALGHSPTCALVLHSTDDR